MAEKAVKLFYTLIPQHNKKEYCGIKVIYSNFITY